MRKRRLKGRNLKIAIAVVLLMLLVVALSFLAISRNIFTVGHSPFVVLTLNSPEMYEDSSGVPVTLEIIVKGLTSHASVHFYSNFETLSAGSSHTCGITDSRDLYC